MVCRHMPPAPGCQCGPVAVFAQSGKLLPVLAAIGGTKQGGIFHAGVHRVRIGERGLQMPHALELPGMRCAVVPLVRAGNAVVSEFVPDWFPGLAAVVGALDELAKPPAGLRGVEPVRVYGRPFEVIHLPAARKSGPFTFHFLRFPSAVSTNAPLRVPTNTRTLLIPSSVRFLA